jgi:glutathionylspermidine synthase
MSAIWRLLPPLSPADFQEVRLRAIFECFKWDPQVEDTPILADFPLILSRAAWQEIAGLAERLATETLAAEQELIQRPELHKQLSLPNQIGRFWKKPTSLPHKGDVRVIRFDFHLTPDGWRISEANADVPGGYNEAAGFSLLMREHYPDFSLSADPAEILTQAIYDRLGGQGLVALVHATAYTDDRQVMAYLEAYLQRFGLQTCLIAPNHVGWDERGNYLRTSQQSKGGVGERIDFLLRFFPAEWLPNLRTNAPWQNFFTRHLTPACNPTTALLTQSKRLPLIWHQLRTPMDTWRRLLPETCDPRQHSVPMDEGWIYKPTWGRIGEGIGMRGVTSTKEWNAIQRQVKRHPNEWIVQRRFDALPVHASDGTRWYPCIGVYTVNGRAAGIYGRINTNPLITSTAKDIAVLVED